MFEYDVNGYHVIVHRIYTVIDGKKIELKLTPSSLEFVVTEEEIRGGVGTFYNPKIKHIENADKEL
jgi:hypothetical protein